MNKIILLSIVFLSFGLPAFADENEETAASKKMSIAIGPEWNMNSRENFAAGATLSFNYNLGTAFAIGINATGSSNFSGIAVIEPAALFRWYFLGGNHTGWFLQAEAGAYLVFEDDDVIPLFMGGLRAGFRLPLGDMFFIEPFGRTGYPFMFGVGVMAGVRF